MNTDDKLTDFIMRESAACIGGEGSELYEVREGLRARYFGHGYAADAEREERGLSTYVDRTVLETVEWAKPGLLRVFGGNDIIRFEPRTPAQEKAAEEATLYVNHAVFGPRLFDLVHSVLTDGMLQRVGWCVAHYAPRRRSRLERFTGLSREEATALIAAPGVDRSPGALRVLRRDSAEGPLFDVTLRREEHSRELRIDPVPAGQVIVSADAPDVERARFIAHWEIKTASDLRREGWPQERIEALPQCHALREGGGSAPREGALREYRIYEAWFDFDLDGDGVAEKLKAVYCAEGGQCVLLGAEEWPLYRAPLFAACSVPVPHRVAGLCVADLVSDLQDLRSEMTRQYLDGLALSNQGELVVNEGSGQGGVEYDSLLARGVGAVHRIRGDASITPLPVAAGSAEALRGLEMSGAVAERRTGISCRTQGLAADALQHSATGAAIAEEAMNQRLELLARVFAETFFKPLGRYILHLMHHHHDKRLQMRLLGRFMSFDPQDWEPDMGISITAGLGTGSRSKLVDTYRNILEIQQKFISALGENSPVRLRHIVYACHQLAKAAGLEAPERFFGSDDDARRADEALKSRRS